MEITIALPIALQKFPKIYQNMRDSTISHGNPNDVQQNLPGNTGLIAWLAVFFRFVFHTPHLSHQQLLSQQSLWKTWHNLQL